MDEKKILLDMLNRTIIINFSIPTKCRDLDPTLPLN